MLAGGNAAPFGAVVGLVRSYLGDVGTRLAVDARLACGGHTGAGRRDELIPGISLRFVLATIYAVLSEGRDDADLYALDVRLGLVEGVGTNAVTGERELPAADPRLADDIPTSMHDPAAMAALAQFGEQALD